MRTPPPPTDVLKYPVTIGVGLLAVVVTIAWHSGEDVSPLFVNSRVWHGELWRLVTSALPHVDALHLLFNLYWLWVFGSAVEGVYGTLRAASLFAFFAAGSAAAEYALFQGGVGLSGVGYGLFGLLWVLSSRDDRFADAIDSRTVGLFIVWFFLCIALTASGTWAVANVAHGMGAVQGTLLGFAISAERGKRLAAACLGGLMLVVLAASSIGRPYVNLSPQMGEELAYDAYLDMEAGRDASAAALLERAVRFDGGQAPWWYNLGIAYQRLGREEEATAAYRRAVELAPKEATFGKALGHRLAVLAFQKQREGDDEAAIDLFREAAGLDERDPVRWFNLGISYERLGRREAATSAYEKAAALAPERALFREALEASRGPKE